MRDLLSLLNLELDLDVYNVVEWPMTEDLTFSCVCLMGLEKTSSFLRFGSTRDENSVFAGFRGFRGYQKRGNPKRRRSLQ